MHVASAGPASPVCNSAGFTLAELLIALAILGVIATFTIPKLLNAQRTQQYNAIVKETAATISGAYQTYQQKGGSPETFQSDNILPFLNYASIDTSSSVNFINGQQRTCTGTGGWPKCLRLHNGATLYYWPNWMCNPGPSAVHYEVDIDGTYRADNDDVVSLILYKDGRLTSADLLAAPIPQYATSAGAACSTPNNTATVPAWFRWN